MIYLIVAAVLAIAVVIAYKLYTSQEKFGAMPAGVRLTKIQAAVNYSKGEFNNQSHTPPFTEGGNMLKVSYYFFLTSRKNTIPPAPMPSKKTDLKALNANNDCLVWFGHSSYYLQVNGLKLLVDPVFSGNVSPLKNSVPAFKGTDVYTVDEIPELDYLIITHDHWDHLDYDTVKKFIKRGVKNIVTSLGTGAHLEHWGYPASQIHEGNWGDTITFPDAKFHFTPARHFSGRSFKRNAAVWTSIVLETGDRKIFIGGDSGYDHHFKTIGDKYGPFDLAILECGQYNKYWKHIHMMPEEVVEAANDLKAKTLLPLHWGKFALSLHDWDEPIRRVTAAARQKQQQIVHPMIGELLDLNQPGEQINWWEQVKK